jgi:tetrahydromethanopterin S-methyltransferase subunit H
MGANWLMFGPAEQADWVFPAVAVVDTYVASAMADVDIRPLDESHPIFKVFL